MGRLNWVKDISLHFVLNVSRSDENELICQTHLCFMLQWCISWGSWLIAVLDINLIIQGENEKTNYLAQHKIKDFNLNKLNVRLTQKEKWKWIFGLSGNKLNNINDEVEPKWQNKRWLFLVASCFDFIFLLSYCLSFFDRFLTCRWWNRNIISSFSLFVIISTLIKHQQGRKRFLHNPFLLHNWWLQLLEKNPVRFFPSDNFSPCRRVMRWKRKLNLLAQDTYD